MNSSALRRSILLAASLLIVSCSTTDVRLYELREADPGTARRAAYQRLESAVEMANQFLAQPPSRTAFPAEKAHFSLGFTDVLLHLEGEDIQALRIETLGWGDSRGWDGDADNPTAHGFRSAKVSGERATGDELLDTAFFHMSAAEMAAVLLRQAAMTRELQAYTSFGYTMNHTLLGLWPGNGWDENNPTQGRAYAVETQFHDWVEQRSQGGPPPVDEELEADPEAVIDLPSNEVLNDPDPSEAGEPRDPT